MAPSATVESVHRAVDDLERLVRERRPDIARIVIHAEPARADALGDPAR
jgi:divalent metal cation (Fe/Co/Zn/Cd) transporter